MPNALQHTGQRRIPTPQCPQMSPNIKRAESEKPPFRDTFRKLVVCLPILSGDSLPDALPPGAWVLLRPSSDTEVSISRLRIAKVSAMHFRFPPCLTHRKEQILLNTNYITSNHYISASERYFFFRSIFPKSDRGQRISCVPLLPRVSVDPNSSVWCHCPPKHMTTEVTMERKERPDHQARCFKSGERGLYHFCSHLTRI